MVTLSAALADASRMHPAHWISLVAFLTDAKIQTVLEGLAAQRLKLEVGHGRLGRSPSLPVCDRSVGAIPPDHGDGDQAIAAFNHLHAYELFE
jgi:hypothetical protein